MKKRILSIILALCMVFCLVPTTALAATQTAGSWSELQTLINQTNDLSVTLSGDISWGGSSLTVPAGKTVTLDLNGKAIDAQSTACQRTHAFKEREHGFSCNFGNNKRI